MLVLNGNHCAKLLSPNAKGGCRNKKKSKQKESEQLPADSLMKRINGGIDVVLDCAEEDF